MLLIFAKAILNQDVLNEMIIILPFWLIIFGVQVDVHCRFKFRVLKIEVLATVL